MDESKRGQSLARRGRGFTVAASPFNVVKVDLAIILFVGVVLLVIHESLSSDPVTQLGLLALYGVGSMLFLTMKVRKVARSLEQNQRDSVANPPSGGELNDGKK